MVDKFIVEKNNCCGCTACANICPRKCITMEQDDEGFLYPNINDSECINCHLCEQVCPVQNPAKVSGGEPAAFAVQLHDNTALAESASGGFFTAISQYVILSGGVVCGAAYTKNMDVQHNIAENIEDCSLFRGSKYVQSNMEGNFRHVEKYLESGRTVCFSGTPCQISGLKKYLRKDYENLITVDLVCAGVPSPKLWRAYLDWQEKRYGAPVKYANFRNKTYGYQCSTLRLEFENGKSYSHSGRIDPMMKFFVSGIAKRPSCYVCKFKGINRCSDFTLFDAWHAKQLIGKPDNDKGFTCLLVHTEKGRSLLCEMESMLKCYAIGLEDAINLDGIMIHSQPSKHPKRNEFYLSLSNSGIEGCKSKYLKITIKDRILETVKPLLYRSGLIRVAKVVRKKMNK